VTLDLAIIVAYLVLMLGIGLYYRRYADEGLENFFLAGRKVPGWLNGVSYAAAMVSADAATAYGGLAVVTGIFVCWWYLSRFGLALCIGAVLFAVFWRRLGLFTSLEFYELRFTGRPAALMRFWIAFRTSIVGLPAWTGITLLAACKIMGPAFGLSKAQTLWLIVPISFAYVFLSGYKGVVVSNLVQMIIFFAGTLGLAWFTLEHFGGPPALATALTHEPRMAGAEVLQTFPPVQHEVFPLAGALAWLIGQSIGYGGDVAPMGGAMEGQRILSTRTPRQAVTMYIVTALTMFTLVLLVSLPCVAAPLLWPELLAPGADRELAYGLLMKKMLPAGMMGLVVAAMMAGVMSTVGDNLNFGSQVMLNDIYRRWLVRSASERAYLIAGKVCMLVILGLSLAVVFNVKIIFEVAVFMLQLSAAELPANWVQWWWWRFNGKARIAASFGGAAIFCVVVLGPKLLTALGITGAGRLVLPWWWQTFIVMGLTTALWVTVALLTKPDPDEVLDTFYRRVRPLGCWGPVRRAALSSRMETPPGGYPINRDWKLIGRGFLLAFLCFVAMALFIVGLSNLYVGKYGLGFGCLGGAVLVLLGFQAWLSPYLQALDDNYQDQ
jgi:solute:Na+ symporter, SSS family